MKKLIAMSTLAGALSIAAIADASAWTRSGTSTGPRGTSSVQATGHADRRTTVAAPLLRFLMIGYPRRA